MKSTLLPCCFVALVVGSALLLFEPVQAANFGGDSDDNTNDNDNGLPRAPTLPIHLDTPFWRSLDRHFERCMRLIHITAKERKKFVANAMGILHAIVMYRRHHHERLTQIFGKERTRKFLTCDFRSFEKNAAQ